MGDDGSGDDGSLGVSTEAGGLGGPPPLEPPEPPASAIISLHIPGRKKKQLNTYHWGLHFHLLPPLHHQHQPFAPVAWNHPQALSSS